MTDSLCDAREAGTTCPSAVDASPDLFRAVLENLAEGVIVADAAGRFLVFNQVAEEILGMGALDVLPQEWTDAYGCCRADGETPFPAEELPLARALLGETVHDEVILIRNGVHPEGVWIRMVGSPVRDDAGTIVAGVVVFRDVTQQVRDRQEARLLTMAVEQTADSVLITDERGRIEYVNRGFESTTGYTREEAIGATPRLLKSGFHDAQFYQDLWAQIESGRHFRGTILNRKKNGELYWSEQTITPMKDSQGRISHFVSVLKDITELKEKERQDAELSIAREIQQRFFPSELSVPGLDLAGASQPAREIGGDYFDYLQAPDGAVWIALADVVDHGIGPALIMSQVRALLRLIVTLETDPGQVLAQINRELVDGRDNGDFVTLLLIRLDPVERSLTFANAGHPPGHLLTGTRDIPLKAEQADLALGILADAVYSTSEPLPLRSGDLLVLVSDGATEALDEQGLPLGQEGVIATVRRHADLSAADIVERLHEEIERATPGEAQADDVTALICKVA